jgi:hypothetical protein
MKEAETLVTLLCASQVLHEALDELQGTAFYKHSFKQAVTRFEKELTKVCDPQINTAFPEEPEVFNAVMDGISEVSKKMALMRPDKIAYIVQLLNQLEDE